MVLLGLETDMYPVESDNILQGQSAIVDITVDVCVSIASAGGSEVLAETEQTIPLDVLNGFETFTDADLVAHGSEWSIIVQVNQIDLTFLASSTLFALDTNQLTVNIVPTGNGFQLVVSAWT